MTMSAIIDTCGWMMTFGGSIMIMNTPRTPRTGIITLGAGIGLMVTSRLVRKLVGDEDDG